MLIVDDHEDSAEVCATFLQTQGFETCIAHNARHAFAMANDIRPDAVVTDIAMPEVDGWTLIQAMKTSHLKDTPIVVVSGYVEAAARVRAGLEGCAAFIAKPMDPLHLAATLLALVSPTRTA